MNIIPDYVEDEIRYYLEKRKRGYNDLYTLSNICALINMAQFNNRISKENAALLKLKVNRLQYRKFESIKVRKNSYKKSIVAQELEVIIKGVFRNCYKTDGFIAK